MGHFEKLNKRLSDLEARHTPTRDPGCDPNRRLARYASYFDGRPWTCRNPEKQAMRAEANRADLDRYRKYFEDMEADEDVPVQP